MAIKSEGAVTFNLEEQDIFDGFWLIARWSSKARRLILAHTLCGLLAGSLMVLRSHDPKGLHLPGEHLIGWSLILWATGIWVVKLIMYPLLWRRLRNKLQIVQSRVKSTSYFWDAAGIHMTNADSEKTMLWSNFTKWRQNKEIIVIFGKKGKFIFIPTRLFSHSSRLDTLVSLLARHVGLREDIPSDRPQ